MANQKQGKALPRSATVDCRQNTEKTRRVCPAVTPAFFFRRRFRGEPLERLAQGLVLAIRYL